MNKNGLILAVDNKDIDSALSLIKMTCNYIEMVKIGLEFFVANGPTGIQRIKKEIDVPIFLDLKLFDIPNTVYNAVRAAIRMDIKMLTIHLSGGLDMVQAASNAIGDSKTILVGVTTLTSSNSSLDSVLKLVNIAHVAHIPMVVCSAWEALSIKHNYPEILTVVAGIRGNSDTKDDQRRVATPSVAIKHGANFLVIGRSITNSENPRKRAAAIAEEIAKIAK
ncbi:Orotidine 5'-phosphate decarboxylase [Candidatus Xenohaliotis californiensis]|uniref:Orotidine 5'-phosphate decarboxylase n=1 Tax=Candidatus Xenohaliotis californiensis TaxID=84677 RepID=A0ABP0EXH6_9RICK|nr:Orotidine 5'-phosphate decarboxylase [Candidatus Xenohaliotis californiensis]